MRFFNKTLDYWKEKMAGPLIGGVIFILLSLCGIQIPQGKELIAGFPAIGMFIFGFLLTILSIILQGTGETIEWMKSRDVLFGRFVVYNKRIVILSFCLSIYSYIIGILEITNTCAEKWIYSLFVGLAVWLVVDTLFFLDIFYKLIRK